MFNKRGRPRKAEVNQIVELLGSPHYATIVEVLPNEREGYVIIRTDPLGRSPYWPAIKVSANEFRITETLDGRPRYAKTAGIIYRKNQRLQNHGDRGCNCHCCVHVKAFEPEPEN